MPGGKSERTAPTIDQELAMMHHEDLDAIEELIAIEADYFGNQDWDDNFIPPRTRPVAVEPFIGDDYDPGDEPIFTESAVLPESLQVPATINATTTGRNGTMGGLTTRRRGLVTGIAIGVAILITLCVMAAISAI